MGVGLSHADLILTVASKDLPKQMTVKGIDLFKATVMTKITDADMVLTTYQALF